ncbi:hypothetical protein AB0E69_29785 [Kribbella sp. NPDC026611]|uniref:hypothetical protein n=1 Tax=Kribbella sp. NPDC026611 TaxID=3154911 RepID=UPI0033EA156D
MPKATLGAVSAALAALTLLPACTPDNTHGSTPEEQSTGPEASSAPEKADDISLVTLPTDQAMVTRSGSGSLTQPISGAFGPDYVLYARCRAGNVRVEIAGSDPWDVACDGVPSRIKLLTDIKRVSLRLTTTPSTRWTFIVAKQKQPAK